MRSWWIPALLITIAVWVPAPGVATDCWWFTDPNTTAVGEFYIKGTAQEIWRESNNISGLQRGGGGCTDGSRVLPDTCWTNTQVNLMEKCIDRQLDERGI